MTTDRATIDPPQGATAWAEVESQVDAVLDDREAVLQLIERGELAEAHAVATTNEGAFWAAVMAAHRFKLAA